MSAIYLVQCHSVAAQPHLLTTCSISQCHTGWCCFASLKVCGVAALPWSAWAHVFTPMTQHDTLLPGGCLGTLVCMSDATWTYRHACFCNCLFLECHVATRTYTLETTVYQNYYVTVFTPVHIPAILGHTCLHPAVPQHLHMVVQPCLFAYLLWYNTASETLDSPGQTHPCHVPFLPCGHTYSHPCHLIMLPHGSTGSCYLKAGVCPSTTPSSPPDSPDTSVHMPACLLSQPG